MKRFLLNSGLALLFSLCSILSLMIIVLFNDNFVLKQFERYDYYDVIEKDIEIGLNDECYVDSRLLKKDIKNYVKSFYNKDKLSNSIVCEESDKLKDMYLDKVSFKIFDNFKLYKYYYGFFFITVVIIFIVGSLFIKTQKIHDIENIFIISFILLSIIYGVLYIFVDFNNEMLNQIFGNAIHYLLGYSIIIFELGLIKKLKIKI